MGNPWTVAPEAVTVNLTWADPSGIAREFWIKIKKFLNVGEERVVQTAGWKGVSGMGGGEGAMGGEAEIRIDWKATSFARATAYLVDWSLEDDKHNRMPLTPASMQALHPEVFELIENAITAHVKAMAEEKKARSGASEPAPTSVS
jgi:hypothetical protein